MFLLALVGLFLQQWQLGNRIDAVAAGIAGLSGPKPADSLDFHPPIGDITNTASGNSVTVNTESALPASPRTVEQVATYLGVTPDTVRESYIDQWIEAGHMSQEDRVKNRWLIPESFTPYRPH